MRIWAWTPGRSGAILEGWWVRAGPSPGTAWWLQRRVPSCDLPPLKPPQPCPCPPSGHPQTQGPDPEPREGSESWGFGEGRVICIKGPSPSQSMKRGRSDGGRSAQLWGHRRQDALTVSTRAWSLSAQVTGWGDRGRALGKHTSLLPPLLPEAHSHRLSLPLPGSWAQAADSAALRVQDFG